MRYQLVALRLALAEQMKRPVLWGVILLILLSAVSSRFFLSSGERNVAVARVGVVLPEGVGESFYGSLALRSGPAVEFVLAEEETLLRNVAVSRWDCGLILDEAFDEMLSEADLDEAVTLVIGPGSAVYPLVRETVAAVIAEQVSPIIAEQYLLKKGITDQAGIGLARQRLAEILTDVQRVNVVMETLDGGRLDAVTLAEESTRRVVLGSLAVVLVVWVLYTAVDLGRWRATGAAKRMSPMRGAAALLLPRLIGALLPVFAACALALTAALGKDGVLCSLALVPYLAVLGAAALLLAICPSGSEVVPVVIPFAAVACFVLCPIIVDLSLLLPEVGAVSRWIPVTLYLEACDGNVDAAGTMAAMAAVLVIGAWVAGRLREKTGRRTANA